MKRFTTAVQAPRALVALAFALVVLSSSVANGVRTTQTGVHAGGRLGDTAPSVSGGISTYKDATQVDGSELQAKAAPESEEKDMGGAATGSRLPDCTHACGPCSPCRRVMVSFRCAEAAESCPVAYRCMCRGRFFRVPTL